MRPSSSTESALKPARPPTQRKGKQKTPLVRQKANARQYSKRGHGLDGK